MDYIRDYTMYTAIFGLFSFIWFGWAQENPRKSWRKYIGIASVIALLVSFLGIYLSILNWKEPSALSNIKAFNSYLIFVWIEIILCGFGAFLFIRFKRSDYVAPWIAFIVGIHFFGLKSVFNDFSLYILGALLIGIAIISLFVSRKLNVANSAITGIGAGIILFCFAILGLIRFLIT